MIRYHGEPIERTPVTPALRKAVTKLEAKVTPAKANVTPKGGRAKVHADRAAKQKAYRQRKGAARG